MFSMKMRWVKFADSFAELREKIGERTTLLLPVNGQSHLLVQDQGKFYLVQNKCPHQGAKLEGAHCEDGNLVCPWHRYGFDLKTGRGAGLYLENYPIEERADGIYAGFEYFSLF